MSCRFVLKMAAAAALQILCPPAFAGAPEIEMLKSAFATMNCAYEIDIFTA